MKWWINLLGKLSTRYTSDTEYANSIKLDIGHLYLFGIELICELLYLQHALLAGESDNRLILTNAD